MRSSRIALDEPDRHAAQWCRTGVVRPVRAGPRAMSTAMPADSSVRHQRRRPSTTDAAAVATADGRAQGDAGERSGRGHDRARRRGQGIGRDEVPADHDVRKGGGESGEHEPADSEHDEHGQAQRRAVVAGHHERDDRHGEERLEQVGAHEDVAPPPAVEEDAGERADDGVGQQQDRERRGDLDGIGLPFGREQHEGGEGGLQQAVAELRHEAHAEQQAEVASGQHFAKSRERHHAGDATRCGLERLELGGEVTKRRPARG